MIKDIAKFGVAAALIAAAPLAFAQSVTPTTSGTSSSGTTYTTGTTGTTQTTGTTGTGSAGTTGTGSTGTTSTTPGVPNTGAGGDAAANVFMLATSGIIAVLGIGYLATRRGVRA